MKKYFFYTSILVLGFFSPAFSQDDAVDAKIQQLAKQLADGIREKGKTRVGITDLTDLQGYPTELGKYLAVELQGNLVNNNLRVINRERLAQLLEENKLTAKGLLDPDNALKLQKAAGMEAIVIGAITPFEKTVTINLLALDLQGAEAIASAKTSIPRTQSIDALLRTVIGKGSPSPPPRDNYEGDLAKNECENNGYFYGKYCFENLFNEPILLHKYYLNASGFLEANVLISPGSVACSSLINTYNQPFVEAKFYFKTINKPIKEGFAVLYISKCKSKFISLNLSNFNFTPNKEE